jgi:hypothetical protein
VRRLRTRGAHGSHVLSVAASSQTARGHDQRLHGTSPLPNEGERALATVRSVDVVGRAA